jgi:hypothetical protein
MIRACNAPAAAPQGHEHASTIFTPALRVATALLAVFLVMGWAVPSSAQARATTPVVAPESPWTRDTQGGDVDGLLDAHGQQGLRFDLWATGFYQGMCEGTGNEDADFSGLVDLLINGDTGRLDLWEGRRLACPWHLPVDSAR